MPVNDLNTDARAASPPSTCERGSGAGAPSAGTLGEFLRVDNLADRDYVGSVIVNEGNRRYFEPAPGRTWLLGLNALYAF